MKKFLCLFLCIITFNAFGKVEVSKIEFEKALLKALPSLTKLIPGATKEKNYSNRFEAEVCRGGSVCRKIICNKETKSEETIINNLNGKLYIHTDKLTSLGPGSTSGCAISEDENGESLELKELDLDSESILEMVNIAHLRGLNETDLIKKYYSLGNNIYEIVASDVKTATVISLSYDLGKSLFLNPVKVDVNALAGGITVDETNNELGSRDPSEFDLSYIKLCMDIPVSGGNERTCTEKRNFDHIKE